MVSYLEYSEISGIRIILNPEHKHWYRIKGKDFIQSLVLIFIDFFLSKRPSFLHACAPCSELPTDVITMNQSG